MARPLQPGDNLLERMFAGDGLRPLSPIAQTRALMVTTAHTAHRCRAFGRRRREPASSDDLSLP